MVKVKLVHSCGAPEAGLCLGLGGAVLCVHRGCCLYFTCQCWNFRCALHEKGAVEGE